MSGNLVLSGGPGHDFDATTSALGALSAELGLSPTVTTDPVEFFTVLRGAQQGELPPWDLVTVNALRWRMQTGRYADQRERFGFDLGSADADVLRRHVTGGGGMLVLHTGVICFDGDPTWRELSGATWNWERSSHPPIADVEIAVTVAGRSHPVTVGVEPFCVRDEIYQHLDWAEALVPLLTTTRDGREHPLLWARSVGAGRVVTDVLGHGVASITHPAHREVLRGAMSWSRRGAADVPVIPGTEE